MFTIRLWHYKLLPVLPDKMIISEWRECIAIKRQWEKGTLKHRLVSYVMDYDSRYFLIYVESVMNEMWKRKIKVNDKYWKELVVFFLDDDFMGSRMYIKKTEKYPEHNDRYLKQCYYNLQEKADRGIITQEEWKKIEDLFKEEI